MKLTKIINIILFAVVLCITLIGCSKEENTEYKQEKTDSLVSNNNQNTFISEDEKFIYLTDTVVVKKISKSDNSITDIFIQDIDDAKFITSFEYFNGRIYLILENTTLVSMDTSGNDIVEFEIPNEVKNKSKDKVATPYTFDDSLYFIFDTDIYRVTTEPLGLEIRDKEIKRMYKTKDETLFIKKVDGNIGRIYTVDSDGKEHLFSSPEDKVLISNTNFTDFYVFYPSYNEDYTFVNIYRVNIDGSEKTLIKSVPIGDFLNIKYDNFNVYLHTSSDFVKIDKETLQETNISNTPDLTDILEPADNKLFSQLWYIDCANGEKVNLSDEVF